MRTTSVAKILSGILPLLLPGIPKPSFAQNSPVELFW
jgi:hypothetical protein